MDQTNAPALCISGLRKTYGNGVEALKGVSLDVMTGDFYALLGPNGAGKSTLLSLVTADHPQAYANDVRLFGRRRGTGESIWDVKAQVGWVAAELHAHYPLGVPCLEVVCSGLHQTIGLHRAPTDDELARARRCLRALGLESYAALPLGRLHHGAQRLMLLARGIVHDLLLLVLDEPCQGLDTHRRAQVLGAVDAIARGGRCRLLYVTHYRDELPRAITHVLTLERGRVVSSGPRG